MDKHEELEFVHLLTLTFSAVELKFSHVNELS